MSGGHTGPVDLHVPGSSPVHRARPEVKVAATVAFVAAVVATPRQAVWAFGGHAVVAGLTVAAAGLRPGLVARRLRVELPFVAFAMALPLIGTVPHVEVAGVTLSRPGLWAAWNVLAKATLGLVAAVVLSATTTGPDLIRGLERLRVPRVVTGIAGFMLRYLGIVVDEARRMHLARQSRGYDPRWLWQARGVAATAGTLFVRAFERGERVHLAMLARGGTATLPRLDGLGDAPGRTPARRQWAGAAAPVLAAWACTTSAWVLA